MDPRVKTSAEDLATLFAFQENVSTALARSVPLAEGVEKTLKSLRLSHDQAEGAMRIRIVGAIDQLERVRGAGDDYSAGDGYSARSVASVLASLATDLGHVDAVPTAPQRALLAQELERLVAAEARWDAFQDRLAALRADLAAAGLPLAVRSFL
jgi:hypothetical protein